MLNNFKYLGVVFLCLVYANNIEAQTPTPRPTINIPTQTPEPSPADPGAPSTFLGCVDGQCVQTSDPQARRCHGDPDCSGFSCDINGRCILGGSGNGCSTDSDCLQKRCGIDSSGAKFCGKSGKGGSCKSANDCPDKYCQLNKTCTADFGTFGVCAEDNDCANQKTGSCDPLSQKCMPKGTAGTSGTCYTDGDCKFSGCGLSKCLQGVYYGKPCSSDQECAGKVCNIPLAACTSLFAGNASCKSDSDCEHRICIDNVCSILSGPGKSNCSTPDDCLKFKVCAQGKCTEIFGKGKDECSSDTECNYKTCMFGMCQWALVPKMPGMVECASSDDCDANNMHKECSSGMCVTFVGAGKDKCSSYRDCTPSTPTPTSTPSPTRSPSVSPSPKSSTTPAGSPARTPSIPIPQMNQMLNNAKAAQLLDEQQYLAAREEQIRQAASAAQGVTEERHLECRAEKCVYFIGGGKDFCATDTQCRQDYKELTGDNLTGNNYSEYKNQANKLANNAAAHVNLANGSETSNQIVKKLASITARQSTSIGYASAPITIVMFHDLKCGMCKRAFLRAILPLYSDYIYTGFVRLVFADYPIINIKSEEIGLAVAARCAGEQAKYVKYVRYLLENMQETSLEKVINYAKALKLDTDKFKSCLLNSKIQDSVESDRALGVELGVNGTPTFFINGEELLGAADYARFVAIINKQLSEKGLKPPRVG